VCGNEDPQKAKKENEFALRAIFGISPSANALHASISYAAALAEADLLFPEIERGQSLQQGDAICGASRRQLVSVDAGKSLKEPVIVILCDKVLEEEEHYNVIDSLMREDFRVTNIRQTWLSVKQATELAGAMGQRFSSARAHHDTQTYLHSNTESAREREKHVLVCAEVVCPSYTGACLRARQ
jgi:hypothetical protein